MSKAKITQEQAGAIESAKRNSDGYGWILGAHANGPKSWMNSYAGLNGMDMDDLGKALYIGYEIEPEKPKFKSGDKIIRGNKITKLDFKASTKNAWYDDTECFLFENEFRHATPEEIYWMETLGRKEVCVFYHGDIAIYKNGQPIRVIAEPFDFEYAKADYRHGLIAGIYPGESYKPFPKEESK